MSEPLLFQSLAFNKTPWTRWFLSFVIHTGVALVLIAIPATVERVMQPQNRVEAISLVIPKPPVQVKPAPVHARPIAVPEKPLPVIETRRVPFQAPAPKPLPVKTIEVPTPVDIPKPSEIVHIDTPKLDLPVRPMIKQEVFQANNAAPQTPEVPAKLIKTGGFGDPNGVPATSDAANKALTIQKTGAFDSPPGPGNGTGLPGKVKAVASAGFGTAMDSAISGSGNRTAIRGSGFGDFVSAAPAAPAARIAAPVETPVEITFKPKPVYTPEAREKKIEGQVQLEVLFSSTGQIRVLRVIGGLGFGLDETARDAANQIRFHPATRNGSPVDITGTVRIVFELT